MQILNLVIENLNLMYVLIVEFNLLNLDYVLQDQQLFHAYYAPADHKPPPGYVRLSVDEFNKMFKDADIHYVNNPDGNSKDVKDSSTSSQTSSPLASVSSSSISSSTSSSTESTVIESKSKNTEIANS